MRLPSFKFHQHPNYLKAANWLSELQPLEDADAVEFALEYAKKKHEEACYAFEALDRKADDLLKFAGVVAVGAMSAIKGFNVTLTWALFSAFLAFVVSAILAAICRWPSEKAIPSQVPDVIGDLRDCGLLRVKTGLAASFYCAAEGVRIISDRKAVLVRYSSVSLCLGLVILLFTMMPIIGVPLQVGK